MKKLILISLLTFTYVSSAQMAVTDPGNQIVNQANLAKNSAILVKATSTLSTLKNMKGLSEELKSNIEVVTDAIAAGKQIINIKNRIDDISDVYERSVNQIMQEDLFSFDEKEFLVWMFTSVLTDSLSNLDDAIKLTGSGSYKMNDAERLGFLTTVEDEMNHQYSLIIYMRRKLFRSIREVKVKTANNNILRNANASFND